MTNNYKSEIHFQVNVTSEEGINTVLTTDGIANRCSSYYMSLCASCFAAPLVAVRRQLQICYYIMCIY